MFGEAPKADPEPSIDVKTLHAKIGELTLENDPPQGLRGRTAATVPAPMSGALGPRRACCRAQENDRSHRQAERQPPGHRVGDQPGCRLLSAPPGIGRRPEADETLIDRLHTDHPFAGSRMARRDCWSRRASRLVRCACPDADEAYGDRGPLPSAEYFEAGAGPQDLPVSGSRDLPITRPN